MDSDSTQLCRVCLQNSDDLVNIFDEFEDAIIASILNEHFSFEVKRDDELTEWLCQICWIQIQTFHIFYKRIEFLRASHHSSTELSSSGVIPKEAFEFNLNSIKFEETKLTKVNVPMRIDNSSDCDDVSDCVESNNSRTSDDDGQSSNENSKDEHVGDMQISKSSSDYDDDKASDGSNDLRTSDDEDQSSNENPKDDHIVEINVIGTTTSGAITKTKRRRLTPSEVDKRNAQIREFFRMKCEICSDVEFETFLTAREHYLEVHKISGYLMCCGKKFYRHSTMLNHIRRHVNPDYMRTCVQNAQIREFFSMKCEICSDVEFETFLRAKHHYRKVHNIDGYIVCCERKFHYQSSVKYHINRHLNPDFTHFRSKMKKQNVQIREFFTMKCDVCTDDVEFETLHNARQHYREIHKTKGYLMCCEKKFYRNVPIMNHIRRHVNPDAFRCDQCGKVCATKYSLRDHINSHVPLNSRAHKCSLCSSSFVTAKKLQLHEENKHYSKTGEMFTCERCNKKYPSKLLLTCHIRNMHVPSVNHVCEICARQFKTNTLLQYHKDRMHPTTRQPKLQCSICSAWLKHEPGLRSHMQRHSRNKDDMVNCPICKKLVKDKILLRAHMKSAHGERNHRCTLCDKAFRSAMLLKEHIACHTGESLYNCLFCEKKFKSSANMRSHRRKVHLAEWTQYLEKKRLE